MLEKEIILTPLRDHRLPPLKSPHRTRLEFVCFLLVLNQLEGGARWQQLKGQRRPLRGFRVMLTLAEMELSSLERGGTTTVSTYEHSEFSQEGIGPADEQRNHHCHHHPNAPSYMPRHAVWWRGAATTELIVVIYLLNKSHVGCCLSSSPWIFIHFVHLSASGGSVLTVCTFVLCSVNCSHPEFDCYCSLLITRLSLQLQRCEKTYLTGKARISCKANESGTT